jgi:hypothetical protein
MLGADQLFTFHLSLHPLLAPPLITDALITDYFRTISLRPSARDV